MNIKVSIGSRSLIKRKALTGALVTAGLHGIEPIDLEAPSGVNAQPVGVEEISRGAHNRASAAAEAVPGSLAVGIESGIVYGADDANENDVGWSDIAMVVILLPNGCEVTRWSRAVRLPASAVEKAKSRGFSVCTVGKILSEEYDSDPSDAVAPATGGRLTREKVLAEAIAAALAEAKASAADIFKTAVTSYEVRVGNVRRILPVREVAPGVRVALFNVLDDWELTEAAGKELAKKMCLTDMEGDALVMPDGKAVALLHVLGRQLRMPIFVARKERKPYMGDTVRSVTYRSITTNREQSLFLSADNAAALKGKRVVIVDDVVSTGGSIDAVKALMAEIGAEVTGIATIFCEGKDRPDVCSLGLLPLF